MKKILFYFTAILYLQTSLSQVTTETICFSSENSGGVELRTFFEENSKWEGAYIKHQKSRVPVSLVLLSSTSIEIAEGRPWELTQTWVEVIDGKITGEYELVTRGTYIGALNYTKRHNKKQYSYRPDNNILRTKAGCQWE